MRNSLVFWHPQTLYSEKLSSNEIYGVGLHLLRTAQSTYRIDSAFCLISSFLTKVIRKHPDLDHKY